MKICTYYEPIEGSDQKDHQNLVNLWKKNWSDHGYEPIVLGIADAEEHRDFRPMEAKIETLPTVNKIAYEGSCYRRWLAFQRYSEGEKEDLLVSDYDVFNYSTHSPFKEAFNPLLYRIAEDQIAFFSFLHGTLNCPEGKRRMNASVRPDYRKIFAWIVPCLAYAGAEGLQYIVDLILKHESIGFDNIHDIHGNLVPHTSDQFIITQNSGDPHFIENHQCMEAYFEPGWERFPVSHYPTGRMIMQQKVPRSLWIAKCREGL